MGTQPYSARGTEATGAAAGRRQIVVATLILALLLALFVRAGFWQLDRASQKEMLQAEFAGGTQAPALTAPPDAIDIDRLRFRRVELRGSYLADRQILLDNMVAKGQNGYQVLTPFRTGTTTVLVNRGWVKAMPDRAVLPNIGVDSGPRTIVARLANLSAPGIRLAAPADPNAEWPRRMLYPDQPALADALELNVPDYQLLLEAESADGYQRDWQANTKGPLTNYGYAFQWFAFAALAITLYIIITLRWRRQRRADTQTKN